MSWHGNEICPGAGTVDSLGLKPSEDFPRVGSNPTPGTHESKIY